MENIMKTRQHRVKLIYIYIKNILIESTDWIRFRWPGKRVGLALGVFDFCHDGHINLLRRAASACDMLIVGVHTDANVIAYKGVRPANSQLERVLAVKQLGIASKVVIFTDRKKICKQYSVNVVFHGDDWNADQYRKQWGEDLISELNISIEMIPHTPGVNSTSLRNKQAPIGWWMHSSVSEWTRVHFFDHMRDLYQELGGIWIVSLSGRELVKKFFPNAPCFLLEEGLDSYQASKELSEYNMDIVVSVCFHSRMQPVLTSSKKKINLIILSHGRSGKKKASADASRILGAKNKPIKDGSLIIHDWSHDFDCYNHFDRFIRNGGMFKNPIPKLNKPRVLILPTWSTSEDADGLLQSKSWSMAFADIQNKCELILAPHPLADKKAINQFLTISGAKLIETNGRSFEQVPLVNCVVCDLSGVFWESMLFDTPVVLALPESGYSWPDDLRPSYAETNAVVPFLKASEIAPAVLELLDKRSPEQFKIATLRLGNIDGKATERIVKRIRGLMEENSDH